MFLPSLAALYHRVGIPAPQFSVPLAQKAAEAAQTYVQTGQDPDLIAGQMGLDFITETFVPVQLAPFVAAPMHRINLLMGYRDVGIADATGNGRAASVVAFGPQNPKGPSMVIYPVHTFPSASWDGNEWPIPYPKDWTPPLGYPVTIQWRDARSFGWVTSMALRHGKSPVDGVTGASQYQGWVFIPRSPLAPGRYTLVFHYTESQNRARVLRRPRCVR